MRVQVAGARGGASPAAVWGSSVGMMLLRALLLCVLVIAPGADAASECLPRPPLRFITSTPLLPAASPPSPRSRVYQLPAPSAHRPPRPICGSHLLPVGILFIITGGTGRRNERVGWID